MVGLEGWSDPMLPQGMLQKNWAMPREGRDPRVLTFQLVMPWWGHRGEISCPQQSHFLITKIQRALNLWFRDGKVIRDTRIG